MTTDTARGRIEGIGDTRTARFERVIAHSPDAVWEALTSSRVARSLVHDGVARAPRGR